MIAAACFVVAIGLLFVAPRAYDESGSGGLLLYVISAAVMIGLGWWMLEAAR